MVPIMVVVVVAEAMVMAMVIFVVLAMVVVVFMIVIAWIHCDLARAGLRPPAGGRSEFFHFRIF